MTPEKILNIARSQIGTKESPANSNRVKYNTEYYGREVSGSNYAYCPTLKTYHKAQAVTDYKPGDVIFFNFSGKSNAAHVGICESWDGKYITTIDGNTGTTNEANGGAVLRCKRGKKYIVGAYRPAYQKKGEVDMTEDQVKKIAKEVVTQLLAAENRSGYTQFCQYMDQYRQDLGKQPAPSWAVNSGELAQAIEMGITDGSRPQDFVTRAEAAAMAVRAAK